VVGKWKYQDHTTVASTEFYIKFMTLCVVAV